jgi:hypothetical protein
MNRSKLVPKLLTFLALAIVFLSFSTSAQAATRIRPIDDYAGEYTVFFGVDLPGSFIGWGDPDSGLVIHPHAANWLDPVDAPIPHLSWLFWEYKLLAQCPHNGIITEREIDEEHTLISINLHVKEVPFMLFNLYFSGIYPYYANYEPLSAGIMQYNFQIKIIFNTVFLYEWFEEYGRLPSIMEISRVFPNPTLPPTPENIPVITFMHITGEGYLTEGGEGTVEVNQVAILDSDIGDFVWPVEKVIVE